MPAKSVPARKNILDSGEGKERSQQEGREESKTPLLILCLPFRSRELAHLSTGLNTNKKGYLKVIRFVVLSPFQMQFHPLRLHSECQLLKTIALLHHVDGF